MDGLETEYGEALEEEYRMSGLLIVKQSRALRRVELIVVALLIAIFAIICCTRDSTQPKPTGELLRNIEPVLGRKGVSLHRTLRDIQVIAKKVTLSKDFSGLEACLKSEGLTVDRTENKIDCMVKEGAYKSPRGHTYDLSLTFWNSSLIPCGCTVAKFQTVMNVPYLELVGPRKGLLAPLLQKKRKPMDPVLSKAFLHPLVSEASGKYPIVKELEVEYGLFGDPALDAIPHAFGVRITLVDKSQKPRTFKSFSLSIISALDPPVGSDGNEITEAYPRGDRLDKAIMNGSCEGPLPH